MKSAIWIGRRQVKGLIVLLALLPLIPTSFLIHTMWINTSSDQTRVIDEMNGIFRNQLKLSAERFSKSEDGGEKDGEDLIRFLIHIFGENLPMMITSPSGEVVYQSEAPMMGNQFEYQIHSGEFSGWRILIDSVSELPQHIKEEQQTTFQQAIFALISTILIAGGVWLVVNRGLKTDEIRKDLITTISHEIKTPVSAIKILAESLESGDLDPELQTEYIKLISNENERIEQLANRFLTYGRLEKGQLPIERVVTRLDPVVSEVSSLLAPRFQAARGELLISGDKDLSVVGDRNGLTILLNNLLENALKYGGTPPLVKLEISNSDNQVRIAVLDNGHGIPKSERKAVFRRFYRSEGRLDDGQTGVGLGLAISRRITKLMKGELSLEESTDPECSGAKFLICLPLSPSTTV